MKNFLKIIMLAGTLLILGCSDIEEDVPQCIKDKIESLPEDDCPDGMDEYMFNGKIVYIFTMEENRCADFGSMVYDEDCNELCFIGGIASLSECEGVDFYDNATLVRTIWKR